MTGRWDLHLWQPELSPHLLPLYRALRARPEVGKVEYIYGRDLPDERVKLGWSADIGPEDRLIKPVGDGEVEDLVARSDAGSVHIFTGMHWVPSIVHGLKMCIKHHRRFGLMHEPRVLEGLTGKLRLAHSWVSEGHLRKRAGFVLAIGHHGPRWFRLSGYRAERIFDFAYFLPAPVVQSHARAALPQVGFVGRLERAKGLDLFLQAISNVRAVADVHVVGNGPLADQARHRMEEFGGRGHFHGVLPMKEMAQFIGGLDILVLPSISTDDGWGAVISEALMAGTAVVCSDRVGASMCILGSAQGEVFSDLSAPALAKAVEAVLARERGEANRKRLCQWATQRLSQEAGAAYLLQILDHIYSGGRRPQSFIA